MPDYQGVYIGAQHVILAICEVDGVAATFTRMFGCTSVVRTAAGSYTLSLAFAPTGDSDYLVLTSNGPIAGARSGQVERAAGKTVLVRMRDELGNLADADWTFACVRLGETGL